MPISDGHDPTRKNKSAMAGESVTATAMCLCYMYSTVRMLVSVVLCSLCSLYFLLWTMDDLSSHFYFLLLFPVPDLISVGTGWRMAQSEFFSKK